MNISLAVADSDRDYVSRLSEVLQQYKDLSISVFTSGEKLQSAIENDRFDIVLFNPDISEERIRLAGARLGICLYSSDCKNTGLYADCVKILKYQRVSNIYKGILREYADKAGYSVELGNRISTKILAVYSPVGGAGKSTVALAIACKLKAVGNSVLFVSTEQLESTAVVNPYEEDGVIALIETVNRENVNFKAKMTAISRHGLDDIEYITGFTRFVDYEAVTGEELDKVFRAIKKDSDYQYVVIDMDSNLDIRNRKVFELADQILLVEKPGELPNRKMELFVQQIIVQEHKRKMFRLHNFAENNSVYFEYPDIPIIGKIHNYGNLKLKSVIHAVNSNEEYDVGSLINNA